MVKIEKLLDTAKLCSNITLSYSHRKPDSGIAISCNGHWMTFSMKDLTLGGWNQIITNLDGNIWMGRG
jgi:hypothetical protein